MSRKPLTLLEALAPIETEKVCIDCGEFVEDEYSNLACGCGIFFVYENLGGNRVKPVLPVDE